MSLNFLDKRALFINGSYEEDASQLQFFKKGYFFLNGGYSQGYQDVTVSGNNILSLPNAKAGSPNYVKAYGGCGQTNIILPSDYTQLEYIESAGTQYINLGVVPTNTTGFELKCTLPNDNSTDNIVCGSRAGTTGNDRFWIDFDWSTNDSIIFGFNSNTPLEDRYIMQSSDIGQDITLSMNYLNDRAGKVNGTTYDTTIANKTLTTSTQQMYLFCGNREDTAVLFTSTKFKYLKISDGSTITHYYLPAKRNSDNELGVYDLVARRFLTNAGTGTFIAGRAIGVPADYTLVDGITNTTNAAIDTGIKADVDDIEYDTIVKINSDTNISWYIFQSRSSSYGNIYGIAGAQNGNKMGAVFSGSSMPIPAEEMIREKDHIYHFNFKCKNGSGTLTVEDLTTGTTATASNTYTFTAATSNIGLFSNLNGGNVPANNTTVYSAYIKKSGEYVMNYTACTYNNEAGFYDSVSNSFKGATQGTLQAGSAITPSPDNIMPIVCNNGILKLSPNLISASQASSTEDNGITLTSDGNGNYTLNGTATAQAVFVINLSQFTIPVAVNNGGSGFLALNNDFASNNVIIQFYNNNSLIDAWNCGSVNRSSGSYSSMANKTVNKMRITVQSGTSITNGKLSPAIYNDGRTTAGTFVKGGGLIADGTAETVKVYGKNLFDQSVFETNTGTTIVYKAYSISNGTYTMSTPDFSLENAGANVFILAGEVTSGAGSGNNGVTSTTPRTITVTDGKYTVAYRSRSTNTNNPKDFNWQLERGSSATTYQAYQMQTATCENLLAVDTYKDVQSILDGAITRNIGVIVLKGTETLDVPGTTLSGYRIFRITNFFDNFQTYSQQKLLCTHFKPVVSSTYATANTATWYKSGTSLTKQVMFCIGEDVIGVNSETANSIAVNAFKAWLANQYAAGTPVIVVYPLATATTETVTGQTLTLQEGNNTIEIATASLDTLGLEVSYKAGVSVTVEEIEAAQLDNSVTVTIS